MMFSALFFGVFSYEFHNYTALLLLIVTQENGFS